MHSLTPIIYYFVGSRDFAYLPPSSNLKLFKYKQKGFDMIFKKIKSLFSFRLWAVLSACRCCVASRRRR
ncbi:MAG: hypothetical protein QS721_06725 [Candidatus Endonucleobacter sp. (ex Gigantidas childressi)]|nr:hypothetical protein [Candidatus Endonucleobacter sp. (ex Gigantidas childressi)]